MKTQTLIDAINFVYSMDRVKEYIAEFEAPPIDFIIFQSGVTVIDYRRNILQVLINFKNLQNNEAIREDLLVDVQGTNLSNFVVLKMVGI